MKIDTGAISYINPAYYDTPDALHPQQLWYDVNGRLLGADFSQLVATHPKSGFASASRRRASITRNCTSTSGSRHPDGTIEYGLYVRASTSRPAASIHCIPRPKIS